METKPETKTETAVAATSCPFIQFVIVPQFVKLGASVHAVSDALAIDTSVSRASSRPN